MKDRKLRAAAVACSGDSSSISSASAIPVEMMSGLPVEAA